ncbi:MAG: DUF6398 domain-containing protein [Saprospiraceae bacterium]
MLNNIESDKSFEVQRLVSQFCLPTLGHEYNYLAVNLCKKLEERKSKIIHTGKPELWAAAIVHSIAILNFLFDQTFPPSINENEISRYFNVNQALMVAKSKFIRERENLDFRSEAFLSEDVKMHNPLNQFMAVGGIIVRKESIPASLRSIVEKTME